MYLNELNRGDKALVKRVNSSPSTKARFYSFGLIEGCDIDIGEISLAKQTIEVVVDMTSIAIRLEEAKTIEVEKIG
jgi:ferrous iron transport protein A